MSRPRPRFTQLALALDTVLVLVLVLVLCVLSVLSAPAGLAGDAIWSGNTTITATPASTDANTPNSSQIDQ